MSDNENVVITLPAKLFLWRFVLVHDICHMIFLNLGHATFDQVMLLLFLEECCPDVSELIMPSLFCATMQASWSWGLDACFAQGSSIHARFPANNRKGWEPFLPFSSLFPDPSRKLPRGDIVFSPLWLAT